MRLIDADKLESGEVIIPTENGGYEYVEVFYKDDVDNAPTVDLVKHGHWIEEPIEDEWGKLPSIWHCSECNNLELNYSPYCPNCGAKMEKVET